MQTRSSLARLPRKPSEDPRSEISTLLHNFTNDLGRHVDGVPQVIGTFAFSGGSGSEKGLIQSVNVAQQLFRIAIRSTAPNFRPFEKKGAQNKHLPPAYFLMSEEGDQCEDEASDSHHDEPSAGRASSLRTGKNVSQSLQGKIYIDEVLEAAQKYVWPLSPILREVTLAD